MGRDYNPIKRTKRGFQRLRKLDWGVNVWGVSFYGLVWTYLGLKTEDMSHLEDRLQEIYKPLPHEISGEDFEQAKAVFSSITDEELRNAIQFAVDKIADPEWWGTQTMDEWVQHFKNTVIPQFTTSGVVAVVSDYVETREIAEKYTTSNS